MNKTIDGALVPTPDKFFTLNESQQAWVQLNNAVRSGWSAEMVLDRLRISNHPETADLLLRAAQEVGMIKDWMSEEGSE